jgi:phosphonate transport system substrate-binding protein
VRRLTFASFLAPRLRPLYEYTTAAIGAALGADARLVSSESVGNLLDGRLDGAFVCGLPYVDLRDEAGEAVEPLAAPVPIGSRYGGRPVYFSDVVVRADSPARVFDDLRGLRLGYNEPESHSGHNAVAGELARRGLGGEFFGCWHRTGSHVESLRQVGAGEVDTAAIDSHLLDALRADDPTLGPTLRVMAAIGPVAIQPLVAGPSLAGEERDAVRSAVLAIGSGTAALTESLVERWETVVDADYDAIRAVRQVALGSLTTRDG